MELGRLLHPRSVAVVGGTEREDSYAGTGYGRRDPA
jgi:acyl-CoA synthetase (NDP forming)